MKTLSSVILLLSLPLLTFAHKVKIAKDGTVKKDGKAVFRIDGKLSLTKGASYTVYNLNDEPLIAADGQGGDSYLTVTFPGHNASLDYPMTMGFKKSFSKEIIKMHLIKDGQLNPAGLKRFVAKYNGRIDPDILRTKQNTQNTIVLESRRPSLIQRNRQAPIFINKGRITQDNKEIGHITSNQKTEQGHVITYFVVRDTEERLIANASKSMGTTNINIITYNHQQFTITLPHASINRFALEKQIVKSLIQRGQM